MIKKTIPSIDIKKIDLGKCYFNNGCAWSIYKPNSGLKALEVLRKKIGDVEFHNICCQHKPEVEKGATIINNCAGCDRRFRSEYEGINTITIWEILNSIKELKLPDYSGLKVSVHDSCSFRKKPQVHEAVRSLLSKMNIQVIESRFNKEKSICCGANLYGKVSKTKMIDFQTKRALQMPYDEVVVYCVSCIKSMEIGGKKPRHMLDLLLEEDTNMKDLTLEEYYVKLKEYIDSH